MAFVNDRVSDLGLSILDLEANRLDICTLEPVSFVSATVSNTLGNKTGLSIEAPADHSPTGRKVTITAFNDGSVTGSGTVTHWAITDTVNSRLLATGSLSAPQVVTSGNSFSLPNFDIGILDAT